MTGNRPGEGEDRHSAPSGLPGSGVAARAHQLRKQQHRARAGGHWQVPDNHQCEDSG